MRIAFLCKRQYMGKDVIVDRYARLYEIPFQLARLGHVVGGFCTSYQGRPAGSWDHDAQPGQLTWQSRPLARSVVPSLIAYPHHLLQQLRAFGPDVVIGASDIPHVALGAWLGRRLDVPYAVDLYDNFEGFGQARIPGMVWLLRHAVRHAGLVTTTSDLLRQYVRGAYRAQGTVVAMPSTVDKTIFHRLDRAGCRRALGLPVDAQLIGTAGGLHRDKGVNALYAAWPHIAAQAPAAHLVLAGPIDRSFPPPADERVHYLGELPHARTAELFSALDVGVIYLRDTAFGRYCFPQKAYEMLACGLPIAAASVGAMPGLLASAASGLYRADDSADLTRAVLAQLERPELADVPIDDWTHVVTVLERHLRALVTDTPPPAR